MRQTSKEDIQGSRTLQRAGGLRNGSNAAYAIPELCLDWPRTMKVARWLPSICRAGCVYRSELRAPLTGASYVPGAEGRLLTNPGNRDRQPMDEPRLTGVKRQNLVEEFRHRTHQGCRVHLGCLLLSDREAFLQFGLRSNLVNTCSTR
jgi:hypothetical protein